MSGISLQALLRFYPRAWRARYGDELAALIMQSSGSRRPPWRVSSDIVLAGCRERLRAAGIAGDGLTPHDRAQSGVMLVLWAWVLFVLGGIGVAKVSEHWQAAVALSSRGLPAAAFDALVIAAAIGSLLVLSGIALTCLNLRRFLSAGGWTKVRRPVIRAAILTVLLVVATILLADWAHHLTNLQRNGHDNAYTGVFVLWILLFVACLFSWATATAVTARQIGIRERLLAVETSLAVAVSVAMTVMTVATAVWWGAVAQSAPWFFAGTRPGSVGTVLPLNLVIPACLMVIATALGTGGAARAIRNVRS